MIICFSFFKKKLNPFSGISKNWPIKMKTYLGTSWIFLEKLRILFKGFSNIYYYEHSSTAFSHVHLYICMYSIFDLGCISGLMEGILSWWGKFFKKGCFSKKFRKRSIFIRFLVQKRHLLIVFEKLEELLPSALHIIPETLWFNFDITIQQKTVKTLYAFFEKKVRINRLNQVKREQIIYVRWCF